MLELPADIAEFRAKHRACSGSLAWTLENCESMQDVWGRANPDWLIWVATREGVLNQDELRRFLCYCGRQVWGLLLDSRSQMSVIAAEEFIQGSCDEGRLATIHQEASCVRQFDMYRVAAKVALMASKAIVSGQLASEVSLDTAEVAGAWAGTEAAKGCRGADSYNFARESAWEKTRALQVGWLRANTNPKWS